MIGCACGSPNAALAGWPAFVQCTGNECGSSVCARPGDRPPPWHSSRPPGWRRRKTTPTSAFIRRSGHPPASIPRRCSCCAGRSTWTPTACVAGTTSITAVSASARTVEHTFRHIGQGQAYWLEGHVGTGAQWTQNNRTIRMREGENAFDDAELDAAVARHYRSLLGRLGGEIAGQDNRPSPFRVSITRVYARTE